jgi:16S rRNA (guanine966-N2)-methyltransferase
LRVIAGKYRSRQLRTLRGLDLRPTSDRLRETLFDVLTAGHPDRLNETAWLDVYAGTGAVGIEALSRGARIVHFIDNSRTASNLIRQNLTSLQVPTDSFEVISQDVAIALRRLDSQAIAADFCFLDPPYRKTEEYESCLGFLSQSRLLKPDSIVIAEHDKKFDLAERFGSIVRYRKLDQGDAALSFFRLA